MSTAVIPSRNSASGNAPAPGGEPVPAPGGEPSQPTELPTLEELRAAGFTASALRYPLSEAAVRVLAFENGVLHKDVPKAWRYAPNEACRDRLENLAKSPIYAIAAGVTTGFPSPRAISCAPVEAIEQILARRYGDFPKPLAKMTETERRIADIACALVGDRLYILDNVVPALRKRVEDRT